jgi:hypothetical protein
MKVLLGSASVLFASAALSLGAAIPSTTIHGNYVEARTADVFTGPCFANAEVGLVGELAVIGWNVSQGSWHGVNLDGLSVVGVVRAKHTLGDAYETSYPVKSVLIVDSRANTEQRLALQSFAKRMAGDLLQDVVRVEYQPINLSFDHNDVHSMKAHLAAGKLANIETRAINEGDHICRNEEVWYRPLSKVDHAMPAYSLAHNFSGEGLGTKWSNPYKRSAFVGTFVQDSE